MKFARIFKILRANDEAGPVFRGMLTLALGSGAARLISVGAVPILSRIYTPEDYGVLSVFVSFTLLLAPLMTLRYVTAIPLPRHPGLALSLLSLCAALISVNLVIISFLLWFFGPRVFGFFSMEILVPYWWLISLCLVGTSAYETMTMWATRQRAYRDIARTQFAQGFLRAVTAIGLGLLSFKPLGLLIGQTIGVSAGTGSLLMRATGTLRQNTRFVSLRNIARMAAGYRGFPIYRLPSQFLLAFSTQAPLLFTAAVFDVVTTGYLGLAITALTMPMSLIGNSVGRAFYGEVASIGKKNPRKIYRISRATQIRLFSFSVPIAIIIAVFGATVFSLAFGEKWREAGVYASILSPFIVFQLTFSPLVNVLNLFDRQKEFLYINCFRSACLIALFLLVYIFDAGSYIFIGSYSAIMTVFYASASLFIFYVLRREIFKGA